MNGFIHKWLWERSAFMLASCVVGALVLGWFLPDTRNAVFALAMAQVIFAIIVLVRETMKIYRDHNHV